MVLTPLYSWRPTQPMQMSFCQFLIKLRPNNIELPYLQQIGQMLFLLWTLRTIQHIHIRRRKSPRPPSAQENLVERWKWNIDICILQMVPSKLELCVTALNYGLINWTLSIVTLKILNINILLSKVQTMEELSTEVLFLYVQITNVVLSISKVLFKYYINIQCNATIVLRRNLPQESASIKSMIVCVSTIK